MNGSRFAARAAPLLLVSWALVLPSGLAAPPATQCERALAEFCDPCQSYEETLAEQLALAARRPHQVIVAAVECGGYKIVHTVFGDDAQVRRYFGVGGLEAVAAISDTPRACGAGEAFRHVFGAVPACTDTCLAELACDPRAEMARFCRLWRELPECVAGDP